MKIEKINDKQIRCTLTREDLVTRQINLSELTYGSDKAKALFHDMMQKAAQDFGFDADNMPLMIEAVPVSLDSIILIITKVEDPEELDTRFAKFSPEDVSKDLGVSLSDLKHQIEGADDILGLIQRLRDAKKHASEEAAARTEETVLPAGSDTEDTDDQDIPNLTRFYLFRSLDDAIRVSSVLHSVYDGPNDLYKNPDNGQYYLLLKKADTSAESFNKACNILSEYALACKFLPGMEAYFTEHLEVILRGNAVQALAELN